MEIEKGIAFKIDQQFPALYREQGADMVELVREYYNWLEETQNQSHYNSRRLFEYKDISETVSQILIYFHKKLSNLNQTQKPSLDKIKYFEKKKIITKTLKNESF